MMGRKQLEDMVGRFGADVPGLAEELKRRASALVPEKAAAVDLGYLDPIGIPFGLARSVEVDESEVVPERIVAAFIGARPVARVRDNQVTTEFLGPAAPQWAPAILLAKPLLDRAVPAVGRIELSNSDAPWAGTGWLIAPGIIVTNRHVAEAFVQRDLERSAFVFKPGLLHGPISADIDFLEEENRSDAAQHPITSVLWIAPREEADVAFLRVTAAAGGPPLPNPVGIGTDGVVEDLIAAIGYPARDPAIRDQAVVTRIFGDDVYEKKRLAVGKITGVSGNSLRHDCSTLGGNSGSVLISLQTGLAVGLHRGGLLDDSANVAVTAAHVDTLLKRALSRDAPSREPPAMEPCGSAQLSGATTMVDGGYKLTFNIPIEITVRLGAPFPQVNVSAPLVKVASQGNLFETALSVADKELRSGPGVLSVRAGYRFKDGWITDERVIVVEVREKLEFDELQRRGMAPLPHQILGVGVDVRTAAVPTQLEALGVDMIALERPGTPGRYQEPPGFDDPRSEMFLGRVTGRMDAVFHVSPDAGFKNLGPFIGRVTDKLTATMYEWDEGNHISDAILAMMQTPTRTLKMVTQRRGVANGPGTESAVLALQTALGGRFEHVWASVAGPKRLIPGFYHIKVASRDGKEVWLSSGNWKTSNQPQDPRMPGALEESNREWHAIIRNERLATLFQKYIDFDFAEATRVGLEAEEAPAFQDVELFVPDLGEALAHEAPPSPTYEAELRLENEELDILPLLTPDRDARGRRAFMFVATQLVKRATKSLYIQNQAFNLTEDNNTEFEEFFRAVKEKQASIDTVRIIMRDASDYPGADSVADQQRLIERLKQFGIDTSKRALRLQSSCHTKGIIVDSKEVLLGSQNLTNGGSLFNRDASLLVRTPKVAAFFEKVFLYDWQNLAHNDARARLGGIRCAGVGEETPAGFRRVRLSALLDGRVDMMESG